MTSATMTQDEILAKIYRDFARLAGEIALDRCRNRVLMQLVRDRLEIPDEELNRMFQEELQQNLEGYVTDITRPMLAELEEPQAPPAGGCCMAQGGCGES